MNQYLHLHRAATSSSITVASPIHLTGAMTEQVAQYLNDWTRTNYPDFEISDFWTEDQKKMSESALTD